jgi:SNF2 family DNA or RNA helicase
MKAEQKIQAKMVPQPERLKTPLFVHQKANIYIMEQMEKTQKVSLNETDSLEANVGILGDPPGTGKTKTVIGLICRDKMKWDGPLVDLSSQICSNLDGSIRIVRKNTFPRIQTTLIVTPPSIFNQWEAEIRETNLSFKMIKERVHMTEIEKYEVVVCTVNMYNSLIEKYHDVVFKRFIYDEMDSAYIPNMSIIYSHSFDGLCLKY